MTKEEAKKQLTQYRHLQVECDRIRQKIEDKREDMRYLKGVVAGGMARRGSDISDQVEQAVELIDGLIHYYTEKVMEREQAEQRILALLDDIENPLARDVLFERYINGSDFQQLPTLFCLSERSVWNYINQGLRDICEREK